MNPLLTFRLALRALLRNKMRSFLTMLGIIIGVSAVIAMVAIGEGAKAQVEKQFAKRVAESIGVAVRERAPQKLVIAADPRMLGLLRGSMTKALTNGTEVLELSEDLSRHTPEGIQSALAKRGAISAADKPSSS